MLVINQLHFCRKVVYRCLIFLKSDTDKTKKLIVSFIFHFCHIYTSVYFKSNQNKDRI